MSFLQIYWENRIDKLCERNCVKEEIMKTGKYMQI